MKKLCMEVKAGTSADVSIRALRGSGGLKYPDEGWGKAPELPWFDTPRSGFLPAFEQFWNSWACLRKDILLVICGSATSWIVKKVLRSRGGLHNRVTRQMPIRPFTLAECAQYADYKRLGFDRRQVLECYMAFGGVAYYWSLLEEGKSAAQNFDTLFFGETAELRMEFENVFRCEMKYAPDDYSFSAGEKEKLLRRIELFRSATGTSKGILPTLVTTSGLKRNANAAMITNVVTLDDLFRG